MFTIFRSVLHCMRCGADSEAAIQTYLFETNRDNNMRDCRVGDQEVIDGLSDFVALYEWNGRAPLVLVVGDWECRQCQLAWQWAKVTLGIVESSPGRIDSIETFLPIAAGAFDGVHFVEGWLPYLTHGAEQDNGDWRARPAQERCSAMAAGFRAWCVEVAGLDLSTIGN